jgi:hypothetical protein
MLSPAFDDDPRFRQRVENFAVEQFVAKLGVSWMYLTVSSGGVCRNKFVASKISALFGGIGGGQRQVKTKRAGEPSPGRPIYSENGPKRLDPCVAAVISTLPTTNVVLHSGQNSSFPWPDTRSWRIRLWPF